MSTAIEMQPPTAPVGTPDDTTSSSDVESAATTTEEQDSVPFGSEETMTPHEILRVAKSADESRIRKAWQACFDELLLEDLPKEDHAVKEARLSDARDALLDAIPAHQLLGVTASPHNLRSVEKAYKAKVASVSATASDRVKTLERLERARLKTRAHVIQMSDDDDDGASSSSSSASYIKSSVLDNKGATNAVGLVLSEALMLCFIALMATVGTRVDGTHSASWAATLVPVWIFDTVLGLAVLFVLFSTFRTQSGAQILVGFGIVLLAGLWITSTGLIYHALDTDDFGALVAFIPMLAVEFVTSVGLTPAALEVKGCFVKVSGLLFVWLRFSSLLLVGLRIDGHMDDTNYVVTLIPLFLACFVGFLAMLTSGIGVCIALLSSILSYGLVISGAVLVALKAQDPEDGPGPLIQCFIPWFIATIIAVIGVPAQMAQAQ